MNTSGQVSTDGLVQAAQHTCPQMHRCTSTHVQVQVGAGLSGCNFVGMTTTLGYPSRIRMQKLPKKNYSVIQPLNQPECVPSNPRTPTCLLGRSRSHFVPFIGAGPLLWWLHGNYHRVRCLPQPLGLLLHGGKHRLGWILALYCLQHPKPEKLGQDCMVSRGLRLLLLHVFLGRRLSLLLLSVESRRPYSC